MFARRFLHLIAVLAFACSILIAAAVAGGSNLGTAALSRENFEINSSFIGDRLVIFGVVNTNCVVVAKVTGPKYNLTINKKQKLHGMWLADDVIKLADVDTFYSIVSHGDIKLLGPLAQKLQLGVDNIRYSIVDGNAARYDEFIGHFIAKKQKALEFQDGNGPDSKIEFLADNFFKITVQMPKGIEAGKYTADIFFIKQGNLLDNVSLPFEVRNSATGSAIKFVAYNHPVLYGVISVIVPLIISWALGFVIK